MEPRYAADTAHAAGPADGFVEFPGSGGVQLGDAAHQHGMTPATGAWRRNVAGCAAVAVAVGLLSLGLPALDDAIPNATVPAGRPLPFAADVSVVPLPDATLDAESTSPEQGVVTLFVDGVRYRLSAQAFAGTVDQLAALVRAQVRQTTGLQGIAADQPITTDAGIPGETAPFVAENRTGWYAVFVHDGTGVVAGGRRQRRESHGAPGRS